MLCNPSNVDQVKILNIFIKTYISGLHYIRVHSWMQFIAFIKFVKIYLRIGKTFTLSRKRSFYCNSLHFLWSTYILWIYKYKNIMRLQTKQKGWCYILREYVVIIMLYILFLLILRETQYILLKFYAFSICIYLPENPVCWRLISPIIISRLVISLHIQTRSSHLNKRQGAPLPVCKDLWG